MNASHSSRVCQTTSPSPMATATIGSLMAPVYPRAGNADRDGRIRTGGLLLPKQARYQAALRPVGLGIMAGPLASAAAVADVSPLQALHYDLDRTGGLAPVAAPPYDVIDEEQRRALLARSPYNAVAIDLPEDPAGGDPYAFAAATLHDWIAEGVVVADREPALWALEQDYTGPDGRRRTRHGLFARVRVEDYGAGRIRPHERTHPGPKEDRLRLTRATRANLSPIFSLYDGDAWSPIAPQLDGAPFGEVTDADE